MSDGATPHVLGILHSAAVALFAVGWIPIFALRSEPLRGRLAVASAGERRWIRLAVAAVTLHVTLAELLLTVPAARAIPASRMAAGIAVFAVGIAWWLWARRELVAFDRRLDPELAPSVLLTSGPFAVVRHPLAFGMLIVALGPAIAVLRWPTWATLAAVALCLGARCRQDEVELRATFGAAYARYAARTRTLVPFVW